MKKEEYLDVLTEQIRCSLARAPVRAEILCHIEDQTEAYMEEGMTAEEAEEAAVCEMGDPVETGEELDRIHRPRMPWMLIGLISLISMVGFVLQYLVMKQNSSVDFGRQLLFLLTGFGIMIAVCHVNYSRIIRSAGFWYPWLFFIILNGTHSFGSELYGCIRWFTLWPTDITVNTTMVALLFVPLYAGILCNNRRKGYLAVGKAIILMLPVICLMLILPSISTAIILFISFAILLTVAIYKGWFQVSKWGALLLLWGPVAAGTVGLLIISGAGSESYGIMRIRGWFGFGDAISYQMELLRKILYGAQWLGEGTFQPENAISFSDYMLAYVIARYGVLAGIIVIALIVTLVFLLYRKSSLQRNRRGMMLGISCATVFLAQLVLYVLSNLGILSTTSYCPFLTQGGSGIIITFLLLGLLLSVFRYEEVMSLYVKKQPEEYTESSKRGKYFVWTLAVLFLSAAILAGVLV